MKKSFIRSVVVCALSVVFLIYGAGTAFSTENSSEYVSQAWAQLGKRNFTEVYELTDKCIAQFSSSADQLAQGLSSFAPKGKEGIYKIMNDVATCYFIKGEALMREGKNKEAEKVFSTVVKKYPYAQAWDPRGWFWSIKEKSEITLKKLKTGRIEEAKEEKFPVTKLDLYDTGAEFPIDYKKYGKFQKVGTKDYKYVVTDPVGLAKAAGEGVYPNTSSVKFDPEFVKIKRKLYKINQWKILNSRDLRTAFYKWCMAAEPWPVKQFYLGDILERSGYIKQAVKAYYAVLVHFPRSYSWTYWHTPWYIGKAAIYRIKYLLRKYPESGLKLEGAKIKVINGYDHSIRNDIYIVNPGKLVKVPFYKKFCFTKHKGRRLGKIVKSVGKGKIRLVKYANGDWQLLVEGRPFIIKGVTYAPTRVGESPDEGTLTNWTTQDTNKNGLIDGPYEAWVDKNHNNKKDAGEEAVGDFYLMKEMGVNCIRVYHQPFKLNKKLFRQMYKKYGIYTAIGDFLGKYAIGSGADWQEGTDYDNPSQQEKMLESVKDMVLEFKDEPYVLIWILGNENVYGLGCNADKKPESFFKFANKAAKLIKKLDPNHPVAIASGDVLYLDIFAKNCPDIDIFGTNAYRGKYGFGDFWKQVRNTAHKAAMITEFGCPSYAKGYNRKEAERFQAEYHRSCWENIMDNRAGYGAGDAVGGFVFEWLDEWWKAYEPSYHDSKGLFAGPFLDGYMHEEWLGICSQGDGKHSPFLRQLKKAYYEYQQMWRKN